MPVPCAPAGLAMLPLFPLSSSAFRACQPEPVGSGGGGREGMLKGRLAHGSKSVKDYLAGG